jgi:hypothetical protein|tara:strand:+ start:246 stop:680 length:435 start_codon:yes stop_codon:yes gene_type:complete
MKTFKKYIDENYEGGGYRLNKDVTGRVDTADLHRFSSDTDVLSKLNTWIGDIADREHITVQAAMEQLYRKVEQIGIEFDVSIEEAIGDTGSKDLPITQYGGRMGKDEEGDIDDNFITAKGPDLKMHVEWERLPTKMYKVFAEIK